MIPKLVGMVYARQCDDAGRAKNYGGKVAAPVFASIAEQAMHYYNIEPTLPIASAPASVGGSIRRFGT